MSLPAGSATSASHQLQGRGKCGKTGTDVCRASEGLCSQLRRGCTWSPRSAPHRGMKWEGRSQTGRSAVAAARGSGRRSLCSRRAKPSPLRGVCAPGGPQRPPHTAVPSKHGSTTAPGWQLGRPLAPGRSSLPAAGSRLGSPSQLTASPLPFPARGRRQDPAPGLLAERQESITLRVRPAPHLIAPLARRKINSTFYTLAASVLKFWHICEVKKIKVIKPGKCHLIVSAEAIWRLRCSGVLSPSIPTQSQAPGSTLLPRPRSHRRSRLAPQPPVATAAHCHRPRPSRSQTSPFAWRIPG